MCRRFKIVLICVLVIFFAGCSDWLQLEPESQLTREEFWRSGDDVEAVVAGIYKELTGLVEEMFKWGDLRGDLFVPGQNISPDDRRIMDGLSTRKTN